MDEQLTAENARLRALRADNERQRALTIEAHERALALAQRCDALEAQAQEAASRRPARNATWRRLWPLGAGAKSR